MVVVSTVGVGDFARIRVLGCMYVYMCGLVGGEGVGSKSNREAREERGVELSPRQGGGF